MHKDHKEHKEQAEPQQGSILEWEADNLEWEEREGKKGIFWQHPVGDHEPNLNDRDYVNLRECLRALESDKGYLFHRKTNEIFWLFRDGKTIGRKKAKPFNNRS